MKWRDDEWDYYNGKIEPLPIQDRSSNAFEGFQADTGTTSDPIPIEQEETFSEVSSEKQSTEIEPICVKGIKPWKEFEIPEGCTNVPEAVANWIGEVGVEDSGVTAACAGRELAKKLPKWGLVEPGSRAQRGPYW